MSGFPPSKKATSKDAIRPETKAGASKVMSTGSGGIPASLKIKNAGVKDASRPAKDFIEGVLGVKTGASKTQSYS